MFDRLRSIPHSGSCTVPWEVEKRNAHNIENLNYI